MGAFANLNPACVVRCRDAKMPSRLLSSHCTGRLSHCLSSCCCPIIVPLQRLVVASSLDIFLLCPLLVVSLPRLLVALPLVVLSLCCLLGFSSHWLALTSFHCATLLASHHAGWLLSHLSSRYLVVLLFCPVVALPLPPPPPPVVLAVDVRPIRVPMRCLSRVDVPHTLP
jgi:hypothetical protein